MNLTKFFFSSSSNTRKRKLEEITKDLQDNNSADLKHLKMDDSSPSSSSKMNMADLNDSAPVDHDQSLFQQLLRHQQSDQVDTNNNSLVPSAQSETNRQLTSTSVSSGGSIYRGLYPINEVKEYFEKTISNGQKLYICRWPGCKFQTWKYSQHISRHIFLKHIGIKKLQCDIPNCKKMFKRPESLVQHKKNHNCGFGIDQTIMKDPNNVCGVKNIKRYFTRTLDNDIYVYKCNYNDCKFHTHNSGSIRRHVHNQHVCPFSATNSQSNQKKSSDQSINNQTANFNSLLDQSSTQTYYEFKNFLEQQNILAPSSPSGSMQQIPVEVELNVIDGESYDPENNRIIMDSDDGDGPLIIDDSGQQDDDDDDDAQDGDDDDDNDSINNGQTMLENLRNSSRKMPLDIIDDASGDESVEDDKINVDSDELTITQGQELPTETTTPSNGLYSLKRFQGQYKKIRIDDANGQKVAMFKCLKPDCQFQTGKQISMVRHLWQEFGYKDFNCESCERKFDNEFSLYRHRKDHRQPIEHEPIAQPVVEPTNTSQHSNEVQPISSLSTTNNQSQQQASQENDNQMLLSDFIQGNFSLFVNLLQQNNQQPIPMENQMFRDQLFLQYLHQLSRPDVNSLEQQQDLQNFIPQFVQQLLLQEQLQRQANNNNWTQSPNTNNNKEQQQDLASLRATLEKKQNIDIQQTVVAKQPTAHVELYKKVINEIDGNTQFECNLCPEYRVRTKSSMKKHLKNLHSTEFAYSNEINNYTTPRPNEMNVKCESPNQEVMIDKTSSPIDSLSSKTTTMTPSMNLENQQSTSGRSKYKGREKTGLYSLKKFPNYYRRTKFSDGYYYQCTYCKNENFYSTKSQASMIRHIWQHDPQNFDCPICNCKCENEFALYKHRRNCHPEFTSQHNRQKSSNRATPGSSSTIKPEEIKSIDQFTKQWQEKPISLIKKMEPKENQSDDEVDRETFFHEDNEEMEALDSPLINVDNDDVDDDDDDDDDDENQHTSIVPGTSRRSLRFKKYRMNISPKMGIDYNGEDDNNSTPQRYSKIPDELIEDNDDDIDVEIGDQENDNETI